MPGDRDRRKAFTPGPGVPVLADPDDSDKTPVDRVELAGLRSDIRAIGESQAADRKQLNGRIGDIDREQRGLAREMAKNSAMTQVTATKVVALESTTTSINSKIDHLLKLHDKRADAIERVQTAEINLRRAKWITVGKIVAAVIGSGAFGLLVAYLTGCV